MLSSLSSRASSTVTSAGITPNSDLAISTLSAFGLVSFAITFPFLVINTSSVSASIRYLPKFILSSVAVTDIKTHLLLSIVCGVLITLYIIRSILSIVSFDFCEEISNAYCFLKVVEKSRGAWYNGFIKADNPSDKSELIEEVEEWLLILILKKMMLQ
mgnify:CR=1 FL=1